MNRSKTLWAIAAVTFAVVTGGAYVVTQYEFAQKPSSLSSLPVYPFVGSAYPIDDVASQDRAHAEAVLRQFAAGVAAGFRPTAERFLASKGDFIWDAVRSSVGGYLSGASFHIHNGGQTAQDGDALVFVVWARANRVQHLFNPKRILAVGLQDPLRAVRPGEQVHVYAYFELTPA
jgi:hypothetical protein